MGERLYFERPDVYVLADCDPTAGGHVRLVVCEHPDGAANAAQLAHRLRVPLRRGPEPERVPALPGHGCEPEAG